VTNSFEDRLDEALDLLVEGDSPRSASKRLDQLISLASETRKELLAERLPAEVRAAHVRHLMDAARPKVAVQGSTWTRRRILRPVAALGLAIVLALPATAAMAEGADPGDTLYGTKLAVEKIQLALEADPSGDAELHLGFAQARLSEIGGLNETGRKKGLSKALANLKEHLTAAEGELDEIESAKTRAEIEAHLDAMHDKHADVLEGLALNADCFVGDDTDQPLENPEGRCKGLLNALENSTKFAETGTPGQGGENPGQGGGASSNQNGNRPEEAGKPTSHPTPSELERGRSEGKGRP
jgi:hypothetical protein